MDAQSLPIHDLIADTLSGFGMADLSPGTTTALIHDGYCIGRRFHYGGVQVVWLMKEGIIRFHGEDGQLLKTVDLGQQETRGAA